MRPVPTGREPDETTPLVGRATELEELQRLLGNPSVRLVMLTGPPGVGKSRLAAEAARRYAMKFPDGVRHVDLGATARHGGGLGSIADCCGVTARGSSPEDLLAGLGRLLGHETSLLVLDGCERHLDVGRDLTAVLAAAPRTKILATSRLRFRLPVEHVLPVPPLPMPGPELTGNLERLAANEAVQLFVARARAVHPDFGLDEVNAAAVRALCVRADGLPLVIELLAARLTSFSPGELAARVRNRRVLFDADATTPGRSVGLPATLGAAIGWSHDQLGPSERRLLRAASVFPGSWSLAAAEEVLGDPGVDVAAATESLVAHSLVQRVSAPGAPGSYRLLDSIREFAADQLAAHGEAVGVRDRHLRHFARLAVAAEAGFGSPDEALAQEWIRSEHANLRLALAQALDRGESETALPLSAALGWFELFHGSVGEARDAVEHALAQAASAAKPPGDAHTGALLVAGVLAESLGLLTVAERRLRDTLSRAEPPGDLRRQAVAHAFLGHVARRSRRYDDAADEYTRALRLHEATGNAHSRAWAWYDLGLLALEQGDLARAASKLADAEVWFRDHHEPWSRAWALWALGEVRLRAGDDGAAVSSFAQAAATHHATDDLRGLAGCLEGLAAVACRRGHAEAAAKLLGAAEHMRRWVGAPPATVSVVTAAETRRSLGAKLGQLAADRMMAEGGRMSTAAALELSASVLGPTQGAATSALTPRQREIAVLVAAGRTNRQIARTLGITEKTVEVHLGQAMRRLGAHSRSAVAVYAVEAGLRAPGAP